MNGLDGEGVPCTKSDSKKRKLSCTTISGDDVTPIDINTRINTTLPPLIPISRYHLTPPTIEEQKKNKRRNKENEKKPKHKKHQTPVITTSELPDIILIQKWYAQFISPSIALSNRDIASNYCK